MPDKNLTSSDEQFSESSESSENSDPPVFRKYHSFLPSLKPTIIPVNENSPPKSAPPRMPPRSPWLMSTLDHYVDVYVDGACSYNVSEESKAGVGIWFGPNHPLNVSRPAKGRQTNNATEIEAAIEAAHRARKAGISKLRINTDSKFLINSAKEWIPKWEANSWKASDNKPVKNRAQFQNLKSAIESPEIEWNHIPSHQGIIGNKEADRLAKEGIGKELHDSHSESNQEGSEKEKYPTNTPPIYIPVPSLTPDAEDDDSKDDLPIENIKNSGKLQSTDTSQLRKELQKSFSQFHKSIEERGLNASDIGIESMAWDHEGLEESAYPLCTHVSDGEEDEELLEQLESLDPCEEYDDDVFTKRVQDFIQKHEEKLRLDSSQQDSTRSSSLPLESQNKRGELELIGPPVQKKMK